MGCNSVNIKLISIGEEIVIQGKGLKDLHCGRHPSVSSVAHPEGVFNH